MERKFDLYITKEEVFFFKNYLYLGIDKDTKKAFVFDPAWDMSRINKILEDNDATLEAIFITHAHYDHINKVKELQAKYRNAKTYISRVEHKYNHYVTQNMCLIEDLEYVSIGNTIVKCILTPGHTKGSMCYEIDDCIFTGDTLFIEGCGMCNASGGSAAEMYESIMRIKQLVHSGQCIYPSHSYGKQVGLDMEYVLKNNIYLNINKKDDFVRFRTRKEQSSLFNFR